MERGRRFERSQTKMTLKTEPLHDGSHIEISSDVLFQEVGGQAALLHLNSEVYYGLDDVGVAMWKAIETNPRPGDAVKSLGAIYDVEENRLLLDFTELVRTLEGHGLVVVKI